MSDVLLNRTETTPSTRARSGSVPTAWGRREVVKALTVAGVLMRAMDETMVDVDVFVVPSFGGNQPLLTNLMGHPAIALPHGHRSADGTPTSITFVGRLFGETDLLSVASRWQEGTGHHRNQAPI